MLIRDDDGYADIVARLEATGEFDAVIFGSSPGVAKVTAETGRAAILMPDQGSRTVPQPNPKRPLRLARYVLILRAAGRDLGEARAEADRLYAVASNALNRVAVGDFSLAERSTLSADDYRHEGTTAYIEAEGQFAYVP